MSEKLIYTIGYGGLKLSDFIDLLKTYSIVNLVDVRRWASSSRNPDFSGSSLETELRKARITYYWFPLLGGYRKFGVDIEDHGIGKCFESNGFRAYATYITRAPVLKPYLDRLVEIASERLTALMCKERCPWLCHRKILSDYLVAKGFRVIHVLDKNRVIEHYLSKCAVIKNNELEYT
ncbi:MAG: DUF488 family protein [Desulfurococcaceae archaeon]